MAFNTKRFAQPQSNTPYPLPYPQTTIRIPGNSRMQCIVSLIVAADKLM